MKYFILFYDYVDDYLERRGQYRDEHLGLTRAAIERGELRLAGAYADPADGAALIFRVEDEATVHAFAEGDPYVKHGVVTSWRVRN